MIPSVLLLISLSSRAVLPHAQGGYRGEYKTGDVVELILDCDQKKLTFKELRVTKEHTVYLQTAGPWRLHINLCSEQDRIRLVKTERLLPA